MALTGTSTGLLVPIHCEPDIVSVYDFREITWLPEKWIRPEQKPTVVCTHDEFNAQYAGKFHGKTGMSVYVMTFGPRALKKPTPAAPVLSSRIIMDTGCGYNVLSRSYVKDHRIKLEK